MSQLVSLPNLEEASHYQSLKQPVVLTVAAAQKINALIREENNPELALRVFIQGGGCSGFQYGFEFCESVENDDVIVTTAGARLLIDPLSLHYLLGAEVDYAETLQGAQFSVHNPNAKTTCGCGSSFSV